MNFRLTALIALMVAFLLAGCSTGGQDVMMTMPELSSPVAQSTAKTTCIGVWQVVIDTEANSADITRLRQGDMILNVLSFLEPPVLGKLSIDFNTLNIDPANALVEVDVLFTHPLITAEHVFHGFDVRGVVMGPDVLNADGITPVMNPADFSGVPFGYIDGLLGSPDSHAHYDGVWGYKYFADGLGISEDLGDFFAVSGNLDNRGIFTEGKTNRRHYDLSWENTDPPIDFMIFNYAVYANYDWPVGDPPFAIEDFPINTANGAEAFCGNITEVANSLWFSSGSGGGKISLDVEIFDWQGLENTVVILFADPAVPETAPDSDETGSTAYSRIYHFVDIEPAFTGEVEYIDIFIKATDTETFGSAWFLGLLPGTHDLYDENLFILFRHKAEVAECPPPVVDDISPGGAGAGENLTDVTVTGSSFIDGASLAVNLKKDGQSDIAANNVNFESATEITCDISIPPGADGIWDVEVINGCGTPGIGEELFTIIDCGAMAGPIWHYSVITSNNMCISYLSGTAATQTGTPYAITNFRDHPTNFYNRLWAKLVSQNSGGEQYSTTGAGVGRIDRDMVCDSENKVYFTDSTNYNRLRYYPFSGSTGFGTLVNFGNINAGWLIWRITIDEDDNPVVLATSGANMQVCHWNGTDWDTTDIPASIVGGNPSAVSDFDWNPLMNHYVLVRDMGGSPKTANLYAVDTGGNLVTTVTNIFNSKTYTLTPGIYIDVKDPACRIITWGSFSSYSTLNTPFARFNAVYGGKVVTESDSQNYGNGAINSPRGQWAKGSNELITGCHYINVYAKVHLPSDW